MKKTFVLFLTLCLISGALFITPEATQAVKDATPDVKFAYIYNSPNDIIRDDAVFYKCTDYDDTNVTYGSATRVCPEAAYDVIWMNSPDGGDEGAYLSYRVDIKTAGKYEMIIVGTGESEGYLTDYVEPRGVSWWVDDGDRFNCDCFPILSEGYTYNNDPTTGYAMGLVYNIILELDAGTHTINIGHHTEFGKAGRLNYAGFYIEEYSGDNGRAAVTDVSQGVENTTAPQIEYDGDYYLLDIKRFTSPGGGLSLEYTDTDSVKFTFTEADPFDPKVSLFTYETSKVISAEKYPYLALYFKTNIYDCVGEVFFSTLDSNGIAAGKSVELYYNEVEGNQVVALDMSENPDWSGYVNLLRIDPSASEPEVGVKDAFLDIYAIAFFKTIEDAEAFKVDGITVELDPALITEEQTKAPETEAATEKQTEDATEAKTEPGSTEKDATTTSGNNPGKTDSKSPVAWIIAAVAAVVVAVVVAVIIISKKKKK